MTTIALPDTQPLEAKGMTLFETAKAITVTTAEEDQAASAFLQDIAAFVKEVQAAFKEPKEAAHKAHKAVVALENKLIDAPTQARKEVEPKILAYRREQERLRREEEARLRAEALRQAEEERLREAEALEQQGQKKAADEVLEQPVIAPPVVVPKAETPKGVGIRERWTCRVIDPSAVPRQWLLVNEQELRAYARRMKGAAVGTVPGVEFYDEGSVAVR